MKCAHGKIKWKKINPFLKNCLPRGITGISNIRCLMRYSETMSDNVYFEQDL